MSTVARGQSSHPSVPARTGRVRAARAPFVLRRLGSSRLLLACLLLTVTASVAVTTSLASFSLRALPVAVHQRLARESGATFLITGQVGAAVARADTRAIYSSLRSALGPVRFTLVTAQWSDSLTLPHQSAMTTPPQLQAAELGGVAAHAVLTAGTWPGHWRPGQPVPVALPVSTARLLHLTVGRDLVLPDSSTRTLIRLRVSGLFRPRDPAAPYWRLSLLGASGAFTQGPFVTYGPALVSPGVFTGPGALRVASASWLVGADTSRIPPAGATALEHRLSRTVSWLEGTQNLGGLQVTTNLPQTLDLLASSMVVSRSLLLIASLQLILLALAAVSLAARLLASQREEETALLSARGGARAQLGRASLAEATLLACAGAVAGAVVGSFGGSLLLSAGGFAAAGTGVAWSAGAAGLSWAAAIAVLAIAVMTWPVLRPLRPGAARARRGRQAALTGAAQVGLDLALVGLGVLAFWELRRYSAVPRLAGGTLGIDPVLSAAPVVVLAGIALIPLRVLPAVARLLDRAGARGRRLSTALAGWQLSRRPLRQGGPVLLVILAVAIGTLALAEHQSWWQSQQDRAAFAAGADVRVDLATPLPLGRAGMLAHTPGVLSVTPVSSFNNGYEVLAVDASTAADTVLLRPDLATLPLPQLWQRITPGRSPREHPGLALPGRPARLALTAILRPPGAVHLGVLSVSLSVQDGSGIVYQIPAGILPADGRSHRLTAALSAGRLARYPLRLLAVSLSYPLPGFPPPPYLSKAARIAAQRAERRTAFARATLAFSALAVSARDSGGFPAPFATGRALAHWRATVAAPGLADPHASGIRPAVTVTSSRATAGAASLSLAVGTGHLIERAGLPPLPIPSELTLFAGYPATPVPAIVTSGFLSAASTNLGGTVPAQVGNATVLIQPVAQVRAFPTIAAGTPAVVVDQGWLQQALATQGQPPLPVTSWWLRTRHGIPAGLPPGATVTSRAGLAAGLLDDPLPNVAQRALLVIALAAGLLACIGFGVSVVATVRERRYQDALLAALGVTPATRAGQLCLEQLMLSLPAAAAGVLIGALLASLLVPAVTVTSAAAAPFPPALVVIPLGPVALLALTVAAVPVLAAAVTAAYRPDPAAQLRAGESA